MKINVQKYVSDNLFCLKNKKTRSGRARRSQSRNVWLCLTL